MALLYDALLSSVVKPKVKVVSLLFRNYLTVLVKLIAVGFGAISLDEACILTRVLGELMSLRP